MLNITLCRIPCVLISLGLSFTLLAEPASDDFIATESDFLAELPVVLSATRLPQPLDEAPLAITVLDREMIEASGARTVPDLLRMVPGFQVGYFDGNSPVATYHGHGDEYSRRVQVLIDGRSVYVPTLAGIQWSDHIISIDDISRIEVTRGPNAASYGNNSFLAVVSITTRQAIEDQGSKLKITQGSKETHEGYYRFGDKLGNADYRITLGTEHDDGTDLLNDYTRTNYISYRLDNQIDLDNFFSYQGGYKDIKLGDHEAPPDYQVEVKSGFQWFKWDHTTNNNNLFSLQYYYNYHNEDLSNENQDIYLNQYISLDAKKAFCGDDIGDCLDQYLDPVDPFQRADVIIKSERHDLELSYTFNQENFRLITGSSARMDIVSAENVFRNNDTLYHKLYRGFAHGEYRYDSDWLFNAGFMLENNDISGTDFAPRLSVLHHINNNHTLRLSTSRATRTPTLYDQNAYNVINVRLTQNDGLDSLNSFLFSYLGDTDIMNEVILVSNGNIKSEEIQSIELGYIARLINNRLTMDIKVFKDNTDNLIGETDSDFPDTVTEDNLNRSADEILNMFRTETEGSEIVFDYRHSRDLRIYTHYSYIDISAETFEPRSNPRDIRRLTVSAPKRSLGLTLIRHMDNNLDLGLNFYHISDMDWLDRTGSTMPGSATDRSAQPFRKLDLKISKKYNFGKEKLAVSFIAINLLEDYFDYNRSRYADNTLTTVVPYSNTLNAYGSLQDMRFYMDISLEFN